ncbi:permease-like cell division protein FtsX [Kitasatospora cineracea]|uniref:Cell division protein FtsX n=1 Tax=Kitasatospora cineracea TaxID=88074 RepID=A0A3N4RNZ0_9ACTN|nr:MULTISPECIES: permease-like cell division protein FtsX [Kitasatospora]ROR44158.1 cell division transport system permease protein [Kitasatospora cineracea]RPE34506.1 cell division transport system permease protein [Kitasatospora cineracea]WAL72006.1 permease-like cell division protein FtsX [Kitasatospora sp. YST-16]WNW38053.1 permease-like cell division protein FtsX [Streptomyces sp. Li-HN-5-13]
MRAQFVLSEIGVGLRRNLTMTIAVVVSVALSLALAGASLLVRDQVNSMKDYWYDKVEVSIYFCTKADHNSPQCASGEATDDQIQAVKDGLAKMPLVQNYTFENSQEAFKHFQESNPDNPLLAAVGPDAMPQSWRVKLNDPTRFDVVQSAFAGKPGVKSVEDQRKILENLFGLLRGLQTAAFVIMVLMLFVALLLIVNTVRVSAFSRRRETGIMRLVGASNFYVQMPFIAEAAFAALLGSALASALLLGGHFFVQGWLAKKVAFIHFIGLSSVLAVIPLLVVVGMAMAGVAAFFTLRKYLKV